MSYWTTVADVNEIPNHQWKTVEIDNVHLLIVNLDGKFFALENYCTHDGSPLAGEPLEGDTIICPRHGARFCVRDGKVLEGPAFEDLRLYPLNVIGGKIHVEI